MRTQSGNPGLIRFWCLVAALLAILAAVQAVSMVQESQTWDEAMELTGGYVYLTTGVDRIVLEHPVLAKLLAALPLLFLHPRLPFEDPSWAGHDDSEFARVFLYHNRVPWGRLLFWGRLPAILISLALGFAIALWTRHRFGSAAAIGALILYAFEPTIIAHGRFVKNDVAVTFFAFLAVIVFDAWLRNRRRRCLVLSGITLGLAMGTKFSAVFLLPAFAAMYALSARRGKASLAEAARGTATVASASVAVLMLLYAPYLPVALPMTPARRASSPDLLMLRDVVSADTAPGRAIRWVSTKLGLAWPSHPLYIGLKKVEEHNQRGHSAYLLGMHSTHGWWYYFPVAFAVKTPTATLAALLLAAVLALRRSVAFPPDCWRLAVPVAVYLPLAMSAHINIGIRHLLPIYPFLFILVSVILTGWRWKYASGVLALLAAGLMAESLNAYPYYLAFFNLPSGGAGNGPKYLVDSNIDWGQELIRLKRYMQAHDLPEVCFIYFGSAEIEAFGIKSSHLPTTKETDERQKVDCVAAISVTFLEDVYTSPGDFAWLREMKPMTKIGYSIYLYDVRKQR